VPFMRKCRKI